MIDYKKIKTDALGEIVLRDSPLTTCSKDELEKRISQRDAQVGFWKELLDQWERKGILN